jgi:hypothetical protein
VRIEEIEDPLMRKIRYLDKLVDELAKGRTMEKILRRRVSTNRGSRLENPSPERTTRGLPSVTRLTEHEHRTLNTEHCPLRFPSRLRGFA